MPKSGGRRREDDADRDEEQDGADRARGGADKAEDQDDEGEEEEEEGADVDVRLPQRRNGSSWDAMNNLVAHMVRDITRFRRGMPSNNGRERQIPLTPFPHSPSPPPSTPRSSRT